jgi:thymidylate synthase (FAD)
MKVTTIPRVTVIGATQFIEHPTHKIPPDGTDMERLGAFAAKGCYDSFGEDGRPCVENQKQIIEHLHGSVLEHSYATLFIEGITRALTLEMNRHRLLNISQRSTRYTKEDEAAVVLEPYYAEIWDRYGMEWVDNEIGWSAYVKSHKLGPQWPPDAELVKDFVVAANEALKNYAEQVDILMKLNPSDLDGFDLRKWARGKARNILPHCIETRVTYTANMRAWRWFVELRSSEQAEPEIRRLAEQVLFVLKDLAPVYFDDFRLDKIYDNIPVWKPEHHKV